MTKIFALLAILLILTGVILLAVPKVEVPVGPSLSPQALPAPTWIDQVRAIAEQINAPLSIIFGLVSLYYSRRTYLENRARNSRNS